MARNPHIDRSDWDEDLCWAANRRGEQCGRAPVIGSSVCATHGGTNKQSKKMIKKKQLKEAATRLGVPVETDPKDGILQLIAQKAGEIQWYKMQIDALQNDQDLVWGKTKETEDGIEYSASVNQWLKLKNEAEKDLARYAEVALKYDIDERKIELARESISQVEAIIRFILADERIGVSKKQMAMVPQLMREAVRSVVMEQN